MLQQLSAEAKEAVRLANDIAREYDQEYVGTEHILLGIAREGSGAGARVLRKRNIDELRLKTEVDKLIKKSMEETWVFGRLPGTPHYRNVVATAIQQAQQLESKEVRTEHLLLALTRENGSVAYQALKNLGIKHGDIKQDILNLTADGN